MGVVCFSSLKGGVGKTTLSLNVSSAFAARGCETLLIDLDPAAHSTNFLKPISGSEQLTKTSALAHLILDIDSDLSFEEQSALLEEGISRCEDLWEPARPQLSILSGGNELRHFLWGKGAQRFKTLFPELIKHLQSNYDHIVIDTAPDFNVLSRNAIALADAVAVPVDSSAMSINCLEQLMQSAGHIKGPSWTVIRTMINRQATRLQSSAIERLNKNLALSSPAEEFDESEDDEFPIEDNDDFMAMLEKHESKNPSADSSSDVPIYLLNSLTYRTEMQNRLSFSGQTCFDRRKYAKLAQQYLDIARELEQIISFGEELNELSGFDSSPGGSQMFAHG